MPEFVSSFGQHMEDMITLRVALGYSRSSYLARLRQMDRFIVQNYPQETCFSRELVHAWINYPGPDGMAHLTARSTIARVFGEYLCSIGLEVYVLPKNYTGRKPTPIPYMMTDTELASLFSAVDRIKNSSDDPLRRSTAAVLLRLIYTCGLRPGEGLRLKREHIDWNQGTILISETKNCKERIIAMHEDMKTLMQKYALQRTLTGRSGTYFFANAEGKAHASRWLDDIFKQCFASCHPDIPCKLLPRVRPYDLRHRFASANLCKWLSEGRCVKDLLPYLRVYMGHNSLAQTAYYIHLLPENLRSTSGIDWNKLDDVIPEVEEWDE